MVKDNISTVSRRDRKKLATRLTIIEVAMSLFKQQGFNETSMEQIAEHSDISKATLYKYFEVKEAIIAAYWQEEIKNSKDELRQIITNNPDTRSRLETAVRVYMQKIMQSRELYEIYIGYRMAHITQTHINDTLRSGVAENAAAIIQAGQDSGEIRRDIPLKVLVSNMELLSMMQSVGWLRYPEQFSLDDSSRMLAELFLNGAAINAKQ